MSPVAARSSSPGHSRRDHETCPHEDRLLNVNEAARMLSLTPGTLYQWAYQRRIPVVKLSGPRGPLRFRLSDIEKLITRSVRPAL